MPVVRKIHQIFFRFDSKTLHDYPLFACSQQAFQNMSGWEYQLWDESCAEALCQIKHPELWDSYQTLKPIQQVDLAKYLVADTCHGIVCDLDVIPLCHADDIVGDRPYLFDRCSRKHIVCNDFMYVGEGGLPNIFDYFLSNLARVNDTPCYEQRRMRKIFQTSGPDFFTRYLKRAGLCNHVEAISNRTFMDPAQKHRSVFAPSPKLEIVHHLSWLSQVAREACHESNDTVGSVGGAACPSFA